MRRVIPLRVACCAHVELSLPCTSTNLITNLTVEMDHSHMDHSHMDHDMPGMDHGAAKCNMNVCSPDTTSTYTPFQGIIIQFCADTKTIDALHVGHD